MATNEVKAASKPKKNASNVVFSIVIVLAILGAGYYLLTNYVLAPKHTVKIDDKTIEMKMSIKDLTDSGFVLCNVNGRVIDPPTSSVKAREIIPVTYYIGIPDSKYSAKNTGIEIKLANFTGNSQKLIECNIYELTYKPRAQKGGTVLIDGEEMKTTEVDRWVSFFKAKGFPFSEKDLEGFSSGKDLYIQASKETHKYSAEIDTTNKVFGQFKITRDIKVEYKTK